MTLKFDGWPWKTIGPLFYVTLSFVHHFKAISEFKLGLQSGNPQYVSKTVIFCPVWPWNVMDDLRNKKGTSSIPHEVLCIISKPLVNLNFSYSPVKIGALFSRVTLKFDGWSWKTLGHIFYVFFKFVHHWIVISECKLWLQSRNAQVGSLSIIFVSCDLEFWQTTLKNNKTPILFQTLFTIS